MGTTQPKALPVEVAPNDYRLGHYLHSTVLPERWCVTKEDLAYFKQEVTSAWIAGEIPNAEAGSDYWNEYHDDPTVGPTMYAVNDHFIKPFTSRRGGMSFALMLNPHGLQCDLFVTHAWAEGVFEFLEKVQRSWPAHSKHAYICFLSNPQNLDISEMLNVPVEKSPFAQALHSAQTMLVVPTRFTSIYNRLWCCYEAYLAYTLGKFITLPTPFYMVAWVKRNLLLQLAALFLGFIFAWVLRDYKIGNSLYYIFVWCPPFLVLLLVARPIIFLNTYVGVGLQLLTGFLAGVSFFALFHQTLSGNANLDDYETYYIATQVLLKSTFLTLLGLSGTLRARILESSRIEAGELYFKDGNLVHASCSSSVDQKRILKAISGMEADVEHALRVLLRQGISTAEMQHASLAWSSGNEGYVDYGEALLTANLYMLLAIFDLHNSDTFSFNASMAQHKLFQKMLHMLIWVGALIPIFVACIRSAAAELTTLIVNSFLFCVLPTGVIIFVSRFFYSYQSMYAWNAFSSICPYNAIISAMLLVWRRHQHIRREHLYTFCRQAFFASSCVGWIVRACEGFVSGRRCFIFLVVAIFNCLALTYSNLKLTSRLAAMFSATAGFAQFVTQLAIVWADDYMDLRRNEILHLLALQCLYFLALVALVAQTLYQFDRAASARVDMNLEFGVSAQHRDEEMEMAIW